MNNFIKKVMVVGLFEKGNDYLLDFEMGSNCLYGDNGTGKTTLINLIVGSLTADLPVLMDVRFEYVSVSIVDGNGCERDITVYKTDAEYGSEELRRSSYSNSKNESLFPDLETPNETKKRLIRKNKLYSNDFSDYKSIKFDFGDGETDFGFEYPCDDGRVYFYKKISRSKKYHHVRGLLDDVVNLTHVPLLRVRSDEGYTRSVRELRGIQSEYDYPLSEGALIDHSNVVLVELERKFRELAESYNSKDKEKLEGFKSQIIQKFLLDKEMIDDLQGVAQSGARKQEYNVSDIADKLKSAGLMVPEDKLAENFMLMSDLSKKTEKSFKKVERLKKKGIPEDERAEAEQEVSNSFFSMLVARTLFGRLESVIEDVEELQSERERLWDLFGTYEELVNQFLNNKFFKVSRSGRFKVISGTREIELADLSSGEKHIIAILGRAALSSGKGSVFIADEPELSLHLTWQRMMLPSILKLSPNSQIIVATHSPAIIPKGANMIDLGECR